MVQNRNFSRVMEAGSISKHGAPSLMSRVNIQMRQMFPKFGKVVAAVSVAAMCMGPVHAQQDALVVVDGKEWEGSFMSIPRDDIFVANALEDQEAIEKYGEKGKNGVIEVTMKREQASKSDIPLIVVDGKESDIKSITPASIDSISMLKDQEAIELFGEKGKNGVIIITTKQNHLEKDNSPVYVVSNKEIGKDDSIPLQIIGAISTRFYPKPEFAYLYGEKAKNGLVFISLKYKKPPPID